jgi:hypothetical protein
MSYPTKVMLYSDCGSCGAELSMSVEALWPQPASSFTEIAIDAVTQVPVIVVDADRGAMCTSCSRTFQFRFLPWQ